MAFASDLDQAGSTPPGVQDALSSSATTAAPAIQAAPAVPAAEVLETDPQLSTCSFIPAVLAVPAISNSLSAAEVLEKNYANTLASVLDEYATVSESFRKAQVEITTLRAKLQQSERETEGAQTQANEIWMTLVQTKDLVATLECRAETLLVTAAMNEMDADKARQQLRDAKVHITFLEAELARLTSTRRAAF